jgi:hypothetical protein
MNLDKTVRKLKKELLAEPMDNTSALAIRVLDVALDFEEVLWLQVRQSVRKEREKWIPLFKAAEGLVALGEFMVEQETAFEAIELALDDLKRNGEEGKPK